MRRDLLTVPAVGILLLAASCGFFRDAGAQTTEDRPIAGVTAVRLLTSGDLAITVGQTQTLTVTAGANQQVGLTSQVIDGTLILDNKANNANGSGISYALTVPPLTNLDISGSGSATGVGILTGDAQLRASGSGGAAVTGVNLSSVVVDLTGSGDVQLAGEAATSKVTVTGSGNYNGSALVTDHTEVDVDGSGDASVNVTGRLAATVSGSGGVTYSGNPAEISKDVSGSGEVVPG
ncbi:MAG: head GIN domain-containing protein [Nakamurella sp.]